MAGKPITRKMFHDIEDRGGEDWIFAHVARGGTYQQIADELGVSMATLRVWRDATPPGKYGIPVEEGRRERWDAALEEDNREWHLQRQLEVLDECNERDQVSVTLAGKKSEAHFKIANLRTKNKADEAVTDLASAFRDMLVAINKPQALPSAEDADYEILESEDEDDDPLRLEGPDGSEEGSGGGDSDG